MFCCRFRHTVLIQFVAYTFILFFLCQYFCQSDNGFRLVTVTKLMKRMKGNCLFSSLRAVFDWLNIKFTLFVYRIVLEEYGPKTSSRLSICQYPNIISLAPEKSILFRAPEQLSLQLTQCQLQSYSSSKPDQLGAEKKNSLKPINLIYRRVYIWEARNRLFGRWTKRKIGFWRSLS